MYNFSKDSQNTWLYTGFTIINLLGGYYIFCLWHPELIGYIRLNLILYVLSMGVQMYWCSKYLVREIRYRVKEIGWVIDSWKLIMGLDKNSYELIEINKLYMYDMMGCDE